MCVFVCVCGNNIKVAQVNLHICAPGGHCGRICCNFNKLRKVHIRTYIHTNLHIYTYTHSIAEWSGRCSSSAHHQTACRSGAHAFGQNNLNFHVLASNNH
ncbi:unnamed protein product [Ceratitis capitata]|uniref:(Mediterranean fruit fly) hypothetical protein n=1 Tax=Ceratitis capitata TaxID=7213 RepID=A0A811UY37_CERCA|nr:unnamed protein product [Ceratitis capitata]